MSIHGTTAIMQVHTSFDHPPIPIRNKDWSAIWDDYDYAPDESWPSPIGHGATEKEAIQDLLDATYDTLQNDGRIEDFKALQQKADEQERKDRLECYAEDHGKSSTWLAGKK